MEIERKPVNSNQQAANCVAVRAGQPLRPADRIALDQAVDDLDPAGERYAVHYGKPHNSILATFSLTFLRKRRRLSI